ncbi:MAG: class I SAM-dependent methyltransferase [Firmicutes bacterium]|nr:class I SAM-dependent methyltransferase [Bacillota bacterium]
MAYHKKTAQYYDYFVDKRDLPYFRRLMLQLGGPVLVPGCGTGRVVFDLISAGLEVVGVDNSPYMLDVARDKHDRSGPTIKGRLELVEADMVDMPLRRTFASALVAGGSFAHLLTLADQVSCLVSINRLLDSGGKLVLDLFPPDMTLLTDGATVSKVVHIDGGVSILRTIHRQSDLNLQRCNLTVIYEQYKGNVLVERVLDELAISLLFPREVQLLLEHTGFKVEKISGDLQGGSFSATSKRMIVVASKHDDTR